MIQELSYILIDDKSKKICWFEGNLNKISLTRYNLSTNFYTTPNLWYICIYLKKNFSIEIVEKILKYYTNINNLKRINISKNLGSFYGCSLIDNESNYKSISINTGDLSRIYSIKNMKIKIFIEQSLIKILENLKKNIYILYL